VKKYTIDIHREHEANHIIKTENNKDEKKKGEQSK